MTLRMFHRMIALALAAGLTADPAIVMGCVGAGFHPRPKSNANAIFDEIAGRHGGLPYRSNLRRRRWLRAQRILIVPFTWPRSRNGWNKPDARHDF